MFDVSQILVTRRPGPIALALVVVAALAGCGQKGKLYLPQGEAAKDRATLPEIISPTSPTSSPTAPASTPAPVTPTGQANPAPRP